MKLLNWITKRWSFRSQAITLYKRGMSSANSHDHPAALADYSTVIEMADAPADIRAMALYNRSVVHTANHDEAQAIHDLEQLLVMPAASAKVKTEARRQLLRMERNTQRAESPPSHRPS